MVDGEQSKNATKLLFLCGMCAILTIAQKRKKLGGITIMRKFLSLFLALAMSIACCTLAAAEDTAEAMQYTEENITIDAGDHQIPATLTVPVGAEGEKFPAVVMLHGNGSTRHEAGNAYDYAALAMAKAGIATIRFDYIGNGDSTSDYIDFTYDKGVEDAMKCYEYLKTLGTIDMDHVGVMGWSQGGRLALLTAARNEVFTSVLTWAGAYDQKGNEEEQYAIAKENGYYEVTYDWREPLKQSPAYYECAMSIDYPAEVAKSRCRFWQSTARRIRPWCRKPRRRLWMRR